PPHRAHGRLVGARGRHFDPDGIAAGAHCGNRHVARSFPDHAGAARRRGPVEWRDRGGPGSQRPPREDARAPRPAVSAKAARRRELRLAELSAVVHMSPYHFARLFKRSTGVPPHRFVVRRRIDEARALLATQTVAIAEIARLVGFRTPSHFATTFRRITGMTP